MAGGTGAAAAVPMASIASGAMPPHSPRYTRDFMAAVVVFYFMTSLTQVFISKVLLSHPAFNVDAPMFISGAQALLTAGVCYALGQLGRRATPGTWLASFPVVRFDSELAWKVMPLSLCFTGMIGFNQLCLKYVEVSFYNVARSLTIVFNVVFTFALLGERTGVGTMATLAVVIAGFFIGSGTEVNFSAAGTLFGVASSAFVSLNAIYTKKVMPLVEHNQWALATYNNINAAILFAVLSVALGEPAVLLASDVIVTPAFWVLLAVSGVTGFAIGIATIMQIQVTSPLTHNISGTAKAGVQTVLALAIWRNPTTPLNLLGTAVVLLGSFLYALQRTRELDAAARARSSKAAGADADAAVGAAGGAAGADAAHAPAAAASSGATGSAFGRERGATAGDDDDVDGGSGDPRETTGLLRRSAAGSVASSGATSARGSVVAGGSPLLTGRRDHG